MYKVINFAGKKMATNEKKEPVFKDLHAEDPDVAPTEIESMCMNCGENVRYIFLSAYCLLSIII